MKPSELRRLCIAVYGERGWQTRCAESLGVDASTVRRWWSGTVPVPGPAAAALRCMAGRVCR